MAQPFQLEPFPDFASASQAVLEFLQRQFGMGLWVIARTSDDDWIVLSAVNNDPNYKTQAGDVLRWSDSFCSRMVQGEGPRAAPRVDDLEVYKTAPHYKDFPIGSYVGIPLLRADGALFGTLCAVDPTPGDGDFSEFEPWMDNVGRLLATLLDREILLEESARRLEQVEALALLDDLTGLYNRRAWEQLKQKEEARSRRLGGPLCVLSIDLDGLKETNDSLGHAAGDDLLRRAALALRAGVRAEDVVARVGGDEFAALLVDCTDPTAQTVLGRLRAAFAEHEVEASIGLARREPALDLDEAWARADAAMYVEKRARKQA